MDLDPKGTKAGQVETDPAPGKKVLTGETDMSVNGSWNRCRVCQLPEKIRKDIDRQIVRGINLTELVQQLNKKGFELSYDSMWRHKRDHLGPAAARGVRVAAQNHGARLLEDLDDLVTIARRILRKAEEDGHAKTALAAVKETRASIMSIAQISHAIWQEQSRDQTIIEVREEENSQFLDEFWKAIQSLPKEDQDTLRAIHFKALAKMGGSYDSEPSEVPEDQSGGESGILTVSMAPGEAQDTDQDQDPAPRRFRRKKPGK